MTGPFLILSLCPSSQLYDGSFAVMGVYEGWEGGGFGELSTHAIW